MPGVRKYGAVLHQRKMLFCDNGAVARDGAEEIALARGILHRHDGKAVHHGFHGAYRVHLRDNDGSAQPLCAHRNALSAPAVPGDNDLLPRDNKVCRAVDSVPHGLPRAVAVIEKMLAIGIVHENHRKFEHPFARHGVQADNARCRFLAPADNAGQKPAVFGMEQVDKVAAVVDNYVRAALAYHAGGMLCVFFIRAAVCGKDVHSAVGKRRGDIILRGKRVAPRDIHFRAQPCKHAAEKRGFCFQMHRKCYSHAGKWLLRAVILQNTAKQRHIAHYPADLCFAAFPKRYILYVVCHVSQAPLKCVLC